MAKSQTMKVKCTVAEKYAINAREQISVKVGDVYEFSLEQGLRIIKAQKGELYVAPKNAPVSEPDPKEPNKNPATKDKKAAQGK